MAAPSNVAIAQSMTGELPAQCSAYATVPLPAEAEGVIPPNAPPDCASYRSYRGVGRPVNYSAARACAWRERLAQQARLQQSPKWPDSWVVGGSLILADIYLNGAGSKRNVPLAMRFACEAEEGMAMLALPDIKKLDGAFPKHAPFEFCHYATTTVTEEFCLDYESEIESDRRGRYYKKLESQMSPPQRKAFHALLAAEKAYVNAHVFEVDQGGTIRAIRTLGSKNILERLFHAEIVQFENKDWPAFSDKQAIDSDRRLHAHTQEEIDGGAVTADHLARVEDVWEKYRDAWETFGRLRYPTAEARIHAEITIDRYRLLKTIE
jgi:hypothetical protein